VASAALDPLRTTVRLERAPAGKPDEGARVEQAPRTIPTPLELPPRTVPDREPLPIQLLLAIALATGLGVAGALFLRGRAAGQEPAPVRVPVAPNAPPTAVALDPSRVEAELQELIAEEKAKELAVAAGEDHARDGPFVGSPS
jgi:hypothetical protein